MSTVWKFLIADDVPSPIKISLHFKGFPDYLKAIRNIFFIKDIRAKILHSIEFFF